MKNRINLFNKAFIHTLILISLFLCISQLPAQVSVNVNNKTIYIIKCQVTYTDASGAQSQYTGEILQDKSGSVTLSESARNIKVKASYKELLTWKNVGSYSVNGSGILTLSGAIPVNKSWVSDGSDTGGNIVRGDAYNAIDPISGDSKLHDAVRIGRPSDVQQLFRSGIDHINRPNKQGIAPIHVAVQTGKTEMVEALISGNANINLTNGRGESPLLIAVKRNDQAMIETLLSHRASASGETIIREGVKTRSEDIVKRLLQAGASPNIAADQALKSRNNELFKNILLTYQVPPKEAWFTNCLKNRNTATANFLLLQGYDPQKAMNQAFAANNKELMMVALDKGGSPARVLEYGVAKNDLSMVQAAFDKGADYTASYQQVLDRNNMQLLPTFLEKGADPNLALAKAVTTSNVQLAEMALSNQADPHPYISQTLTKGDTRLLGVMINYANNPSDYITPAVNTGNLKVVQTLVNNAGAEVNLGLRPAMEGKFYDIAQFLIENGAIPENVVNSAVKNNQILLLKTALDNGADPNEGMQIGVDTNNTAAVKLLLATGADASPQQYITKAAQNQNIEMITTLVQSGASPEPAMPVAVNTNNTSLFSMLVEQGGQAGKTSYVKTAATNANMDILQVAIEQGASPDAGITIAVQKNHLEMTRYLLQNGANASTSGLLNSATKSAGSAIIQLLLDNGANPNEGAETAIARGEVTIVSQLFQAGADFSKDAYIKSAASRNLPKLTQLLIEAGARPDAGILDAVKGNYSEIIRQFIQAGANLQEPLLIAHTAAHGNVPILRLMLDNGTDPNNGIYQAVKNSRIEATDILLTAGADGSSDKLMTMAASNKQAPIVSSLIKAGGNPQVAVVPAIKGNDPNTLTVACTAGANCSENENVLYAVKNNFTGITQVLLKSGADANAKENTPTGMTLLHIAATKGESQMINILIAAGADPNIVSGIKQITPLHIIVTKGRKYIDHATILINAGADVNAQNSDGVSIYKSAKSSKMKKLLRNNGADKKA